MNSKRQRRIVDTTKWQQLEVLAWRNATRLSRQQFGKQSGARCSLVKASSSVVELYLYGDIAWYEITSGMVAEQLANVSADTIRVRINSGGGDVFEGVAIYNLLAGRREKIEVQIDALAASIASVIAMAGDEIVMPSNAMLMVHRPWALVTGNSDDMREMGDLLVKIEDSQIVPAYQEKSMRSVTDIKRMMKAETWFSAQEAVDNGFADKITRASDVEALARSEMYAHAPKSLKPNDQRSLEMRARLAEIN